MQFLPTVNQLVALGTLTLQFFILLVGLLFLSKKKYWLHDFISKNILIICFDIVLASVLISLYYSDIIGFAPCILCWYQRIFLYPLLPMFALAIWKKDRGIIRYALVLSALGFLVGVYHNLIYYFNVLPLPCAATGVSCTQHLVSEYNGFISIPMMSMTAFLILIVLMISAKLKPHD